MITRTLLAISAATFCSTSLAEAENSEGEWSWGIGVFGSPDIYRDASPRTIPVPIIAYNTERLHVFGPFVAYDVYKSEHLTGAVKLKPVFAGYDESDSPYFEGMDDRHWSIAGGAGLEYTKSFLKLRLDADHDLLGINNGYESKAGVSFRFPVNGVLIEPGLAAQYQSSNYVDYYFGVEDSEARDWRPAYAPDGTLNKEVFLALATRKLMGGTTRFQVTYTRFGEEIVDSPLTEGNDSLGFSMTFGKTF